MRTQTLHKEKEERPGINLLKKFGFSEFWLCGLCGRTQMTLTIYGDGYIRPYLCNHCYRTTSEKESRGIWDADAIVTLRGLSAPGARSNIQVGSKRDLRGRGR